MRKVTVCWKCKKGNVTLYRIIDSASGFIRKMNDYGCGEHRYLIPAIENQSFVHLPDERDIKLALKESEKKQKADSENGK